MTPREYESILNSFAVISLLIAAPIFYNYHKRENKFLLSQLGVPFLLVGILILPFGPLEYVVVCGTALCAGYALWEMRT